MQINRVTLSGFDGFYTTVEDIVRFAERHPMVEFGILCSQTRMGELRYPDLGVIRQLLAANAGHRYPRLNLSFHLCGRLVSNCIRRNLVSEYAETILHMIPTVPRVQLNFDASNCDFGQEELIDFIQAFPRIQFLIQYNPRNAIFCHTIIRRFIPNFGILIDSSLGQGIRAPIDRIPLYGVGMGWAGGIGPETIRDVCEELRHLGPGCCSIDMETGIRTDDCFDLSKCAAVMQVVEEEKDCRIPE